MTREEFAHVANKAFGEHPECEPGTEEFLSILNRLPDDGSGGVDSSPGSDPSNGGASLSINRASFGMSHNHTAAGQQLAPSGEAKTDGIAKGSA